MPLDVCVDILRLPDVRFFYASGFNVFMLSYRGYGQSEGSPSEKGLRLDAKAALQYLNDRDDVIDNNRIYIFGRSIGGACAIALAASPLGQDIVKGIIVENTFTSIDDMIDVAFPILRFAKPFNRNKWNSYNEIPNVKVPILFMRYDISRFLFELCFYCSVRKRSCLLDRLLTRSFAYSKLFMWMYLLRNSGLKDELVPPAHMKKLRDAAVNARFTSFHTIEEGGHNVSGLTMKSFPVLKFNGRGDCGGVD